MIFVLFRRPHAIGANFVRSVRNTALADENCGSGWPRLYQKPTKNRYERRSSLRTRLKRALGRLRASSGPARAANVAAKTTNMAAKIANLGAKMTQLGVRRPSRAVLGAIIAVP